MAANFVLGWVCAATGLLNLLNVVAAINVVVGVLALILGLVVVVRSGRAWLRRGEW